MNRDSVAAAVDELAAVLRADGGDLRLVSADPDTARIELDLDLDGVECLDCIMPNRALVEIVAATISRHDPGEFELVIRDPREPGEPAP